MNRIEQLAHKYENYASLTWDPNLSGVERVWFAVYDKMDERRLRARIGEFELATNRIDHDWKLVDLTDAFAEWMGEQKYRESYFADPDDLGGAVDEFEDVVCERLESAWSDTLRPANTVVAVMGVASLFGFLSVSDIVDRIKSSVQGRLLVFFPGHFEDNHYRLLDARDGWNYMAVPITADSGEL